MAHLDSLENESIEIIREAYAQCSPAVILYSIGKDSSVLLHLARKAFYPAPLPIPLLHIDTGWKFLDMYEHRDQVIQKTGAKIIIYRNPVGEIEGLNPFTHGSRYFTDIMKTQALKQALDLHDIKLAFGGARRDEEKSRSKERVFSFRQNGHRWDPESQRPELWNLYQGKTNTHETLRVFPLSHWTELDIWHYIKTENIPVVPLYFAKQRPVVMRQGQWIVVDDQKKFPFQTGESITYRTVRFRTLGCWPLSCAIESEAATLDDIINEIVSTDYSERQGRLIDSDHPSSMEKKKIEGYF